MLGERAIGPIAVADLLPKGAQTSPSSSGTAERLARAYCANSVIARRFPDARLRYELKTCGTTV